MSPTNVVTWLPRTVTVVLWFLHQFVHGKRWTVNPLRTVRDVLQPLNYKFHNETILGVSIYSLHIALKRLYPCVSLPQIIRVNESGLTMGQTLSESISGICGLTRSRRWLTLSFTFSPVAADVSKYGNLNKLFLNWLNEGLNEVLLM